MDAFHRVIFTCKRKKTRLIPSSKTGPIDYQRESYSRDAVLNTRGVVPAERRAMLGRLKAYTLWGCRNAKMMILHKSWSRVFWCLDFSGVAVSRASLQSPMLAGHSDLTMVCAYRLTVFDGIGDGKYRSK